MDKFAVGFNRNTIRLWPMGSTRLMRPLFKPRMKKITCESEIDINIDNSDVEVYAYLKFLILFLTININYYIFYNRESSGAIVLRGHTDVVHDMRFIHDSEILLSVSSDNDMRAWSMVDYTCIGTYK